MRVESAQRASAWSVIIGVALLCAADAGGLRRDRAVRGHLQYGNGLDRWVRDSTG